MTRRYYILPIEVNGTARGPKYFPWRFDPDPPALINEPWAMMDYGLMPTALLTSDLTAQEHSDLTANSDVIAPPANIDNTITAGALSQVQDALELLKIPAAWVSTSNTYREVLRVVAGVFQFAQRYFGLYGKSIFDEVTGLGTTWSELSTTFQDELLATAESMHIDTSGLTANTTMRTILKRLADAWEGTPIYLGGVEL
jgi:hypothetical protein